MAIWKSFFGWMSGATYRDKGTQSGTASGGIEPAMAVTVETAMQLSSVWACTKLLSESVGSLPIVIYRKNNDGTRQVDRDHRLNLLFGGTMNSWQTRQEFFETITYQLALQGNNYSYIERNASGDISSITPLMTPQMEVRLLENGKLEYRYTSGAKTEILPSDRVWHNKLMGNGVIGLSPLSYAAQTLGIARAAETAVSKVYKNGGKPSGVLTFDKTLTADQRSQVRNNFTSITEGTDNRVFVLEMGMDFKQVSLSPQDIELLASRRFQIEDIARFFGVPSVLINDTSAGTTWGSGISQIVQGFYKFGLRPYLERYESSMKVNFLKPEERARYDIEFDFSALLRPDQMERIKMYKEAVQGGIMAPNEARNEEGWTAKEGGDKLFLQAQMTPIELLPVTGGQNGSQNQENQI